VLTCHLGCVQDPGKCPSPTPAGLASLLLHLEDVEVDDVEATVKARRSYASPMEPVTNIEARVPNPCVLCEAAIKSCKNKCNDDACTDACHYFHKQHNANCRECGISCDSLEERNVEDSKETDVYSRFISRWVNLWCFPCIDDIHACQKQCGTPGDCHDVCICYNALHDGECRKWGCKLPRSCAHNCPQFAELSDSQRQLAHRSRDGDESLTIDSPEAMEEAPIDDLTRAEEQHSAASGFVAAPPQNPCVVCKFSVNACKKKCATRGACDQACICYNNSHNSNCADCSLPCQCEHICPRVTLSLAQRRVDGRTGEDDESPVDERFEAEDEYLIDTRMSYDGA
jgi:hypothetical protein